MLILDEVEKKTLLNTVAKNLDIAITGVANSQIKEKSFCLLIIATTIQLIKGQEYKRRLRMFHYNH